MVNEIEKAKIVKDMILDFFKRNPRTSWGKNQIDKVIRDIWSEFLFNEIKKG